MRSTLPDDRPEVLQVGGRSAHPRHRWVWPALGIALLIGGSAWWVWQQSTSAELTHLSWDRSWGIRVEAEFAPVIPTTVDGVRLSTDAGGGEGDLWDNSSAADMAPDQLRAHLWRPATLLVSFIPTCDDPSVDDAGVVTLSTPDGERSVPLAIPRLSDAVAGWCSGGLSVNLLSAHASATGRDVEAVYRLVSPHTLTVRVASRSWASEPVELAPGAPGELLVRSSRGCAVNPSKLHLVVTYADGTERTVRVKAPGDQVCP